MNDYPLASICIPLYNKREYIGRTLDCVLAQTYPNIEIVISDNGSTDGSSEIARQYAEKDKRIRYHRLENTLKVDESWRYAMLLGRGEFLKIQSADDRLASGFMAKMIEPLLQHPEIDFTTCTNKAKFAPELATVTNHGRGHYEEMCEKFIRELLATHDQRQRARLIFSRASVGNSFGELYPVVMRPKCLPIDYWSHARGACPGVASHVDWEFLIRLYLNHRGMYVDGVMSDFDFEMGSPYVRENTDPHSYMQRRLTDFMLPFVVLTDPTLSLLRDFAAPQELQQLQKICMENLRDLFAVSAEVRAFTNPEAATAALPRLHAHAQIAKQHPDQDHLMFPIRRFRLQLAQHWLELAPDAIEAEYSSIFGRAQAIILDSGIKKYPLTPIEQQFVSDLSDRIDKLAPDERDMRLDAAAMLFFADNP